MNRQESKASTKHAEALYRFDLIKNRLGDSRAPSYRPAHDRQQYRARALPQAFDQTLRHAIRSAEPSC